MSNYTVDFSLILATLNRPDCVELCLKSLEKQTFKNFEVIIVDQSENNETERIIFQNSQLKLKYYKVNFRGLSKARNYGLDQANGKFFCLLDDDAAYDEKFLQCAFSFIKKNGDCILSGYSWDPHMESALKDYSKAVSGMRLSIRQIIRMCPSSTLVIPLSVFKKGIRFDEKMGVGAEFGACEETDFILEAIDMGYMGYYLDGLRIEHPTIAREYQTSMEMSLRRIEGYAKGEGALLKKDIKERKNYRLLPCYAEKTLKILIKSFGILGKEKKLKAKAQWDGIVYGYRKYRIGE